MRVSVVLCTYNGEAFLPVQLQTLLTQSLLPDEIIVADDASTDGTWSILEAFASQATARGVAVRAQRRPERLGYVGNFSRALELATGDVLFLCDQDDAWHPDKIETLVRRFDVDPGLTFAHTDARLVDATGLDSGITLFEALGLASHERESLRAGDGFLVYLRRNLATGAASAFRRSLLDVGLPLPDGWVHDAWLATLAAAIGRVEIIDDALIDYRQHNANQIGMSPRSGRQRIAGMFQKRNSELRESVERLDTLADRLEGRCANDACVQATRAMRIHLRARLDIGELPNWRRVRAILREWTSGRYALFGTGARSAIRDLLRIG